MTTPEVGRHFGFSTMAKTGDEASGYVAFFTDTEGNTVGLDSPS
jgi:predicted enzyme related to lactoylglutathione lyase